MTILEPTLYANGALRLTRHGRGRGGTVLLRTWDNKQATFPDEETAHLTRFVEAEADGGADPADIFHRAVIQFRRW